MPKARTPISTPLPPNVVRLDDVRPREAGPIRLTVKALRAWARAGVEVTRTAEMLGIMPDGRLVLWSESEVELMNKFPTNGSSVESDRYVIDWKGHPIAAHCSGRVGGIIHLYFMGGGMHEYLPMRSVEKLLLGRVGTEEQRAALSAKMQEVLQLLTDRHNARHLQRGYI